MRQIGLGNAASQFVWSWRRKRCRTLSRWVSNQRDTALMTASWPCWKASDYADPRHHPSPSHQLSSAMSRHNPGVGMLTEILSRRPWRWRWRGVQPWGSQVLATSGASKKPDSSAKTRWTPSRAAFFFTRDQSFRFQRSTPRVSGFWGLQFRLCISRPTWSRW